MYLTHDEVKTVVAKRFIRTLKSKINKKMTAGDYKSYDYLIKLADEYNKSYHHSIGKKPIDTDYSALTEVLR